MKALTNLLLRMRLDRSRFRDAPHGNDVVEAYTVDEWADELESIIMCCTNCIPQGGSQMEYEIRPSMSAINEWRVEAIDHESEGEIYVTLFSGPNAKARADEYAKWKNGVY